MVISVRFKRFYIRKYVFNFQQYLLLVFQVIFLYKLNPTEQLYTSDVLYDKRATESSHKVSRNFKSTMNVTNARHVNVHFMLSYENLLKYSHKKI